MNKELTEIKEKLASIEWQLKDQPEEIIMKSNVKKPYRKLKAYRAPRVPLALPSLQTQLDTYSMQYREAVRQFNKYLAEKLEYAEKYNQASDKIAQYDKIIRNLVELMNATKELINR